MKRLLWLVIYAWIALASSAQTSRLFEGDEYLGSSTVNDLMQDRWGRIWIATHGGLTRYDSQEFRTYNGNDGLVSNHVTRLAQDNNCIVVGTTNGVQRFSLATLQFQRIKLFSGNQEKSTCNVNALLRRRNCGVLRIGQGKMSVYLKGRTPMTHADRHDRGRPGGQYSDPLRLVSGL